MTKKKKGNLGALFTVKTITVDLGFLKKSMIFLCSVPLFCRLFFFLRDQNLIRANFTYAS